MSERQRLKEFHRTQIEEGAKKGFHSVRLTVTPELARIILENNPDNRHLRPAKLAQLIGDMTHHRFRFNGEAVVVADTGELNDGQHRLTAIVQSGVPQDMVIVYGPKRETRTTIDVGAARTAGDHLAISGHSHGATLAAVAKLVIAYERGEGNIIGRLNDISVAEVVQRLEKDQLLNECAIWAGNQNRMRNYATKSVIGFVLYTLTKQNPKCGKTFMDSIKEGIGLSGDSPIRTLRDMLINRPRISPVQRIEAFFRTWNAWRKDKPLTKIQIMGNLPPLEK